MSIQIDWNWDQYYSFIYLFGQHKTLTTDSSPDTSQMILSRTTQFSDNIPETFVNTTYHPYTTTSVSYLFGKKIIEYE